MTPEAVLKPSTVQPLGADGIYQVVVAAGIKSGDIVMVHSRLFTIGRVIPGVTKNDVAEAFVAALRLAVGEEGTLIFPTFTFSVCEGGHFDVQTTPSEMGVLSEYARLREGAVRTAHPFYSVAVLGGNQEFLSGLDVSTCFGTHSIFDRLHSLNTAHPGADRVKFLTLGIDCPPEGITYIHSIEEKLQVPYRYHKTFQGETTDQGQSQTYAVDFFVRKRDSEVHFDGDRCWALLKAHEQVTFAPLGDSIACVAPESAVYSALVEAISDESDFLCRGGYRPQAG